MSEETQTDPNKLLSALFIIPAAYRESFNSLAEAMGWGPGVFSVALSADGTEPATHYCTRGQMSGAFLAQMDDPAALIAGLGFPPEVQAALLAQAVPLMALLTVDVADMDGAAHHVAVFARDGLAVVQADPTI